VAAYGGGVSARGGVEDRGGALRHANLTTEVKRGTKDLEIRSEDRFSRGETEAIYKLPGVAGVFAPTPRKLLVGFANEHDMELVRTEIMRILKSV